MSESPESVIRDYLIRDSFAPWYLLAALDALVAERDESVEECDLLKGTIGRMRAERDALKAWIDRVSEGSADAASAAMRAEAERDGLRAAIAHVIEASPGTPDSVKRYLIRELEGSWGGPYEDAIVADVPAGDEE